MLFGEVPKNAPSLNRTEGMSASGMGSVCHQPCKRTLIVDIEVGVSSDYESSEQLDFLRNSQL